MLAFRPPFALFRDRVRFAYFHRLAVHRVMRWNRLLLSAESISARTCILGQKMPFQRCHRGTDEDAFLTICRWFSVVRVLLLLLLLLLLLTHLVHDDGLSVQIIIHERKLRVKGVGSVRVVVLSIRVAFHPLRGIVVGYVLVLLLLGGEAHLRHERVLLLLLTRISHDDSFLSRFESDGI